MLHVGEAAVGVVPFVVYLTTVPQVHGLQLIVDVLPLNRYHTGVHVGAHVGESVSIPFRVIVKFTVLFSLSFICTVQVSLPTCHAFGVYVIPVVPACEQTHLFHCVTIPL